MNSKKYLIFLFTFLMLFLGFHFLTWNLVTKTFFPSDEENVHVGDLARISYIKSSLELKENRITLSKRHTNDKTIPTDVITIGDSFSQGGASGLNPYYQDYIATLQSLKVTNIEASPKGYIETVLLLNANGTLDKLKPKAIILQSIERSAIKRYAKKIDWNIEELKPEEPRAQTSHNQIKKSASPEPSFINSLNYNALIYNILYNYDDNAFYSKVYKVLLEKKLFSSKKKEQLLFFFEDIKNINYTNEVSIEQLNQNLNKLQDILNKKGIKLYFMPSVDKYNLYSSYIVQKNSYQKSLFFELLRPLQRDYTLIDTKKILEKMLQENINDVYYPDDTHWSYKASKRIFTDVILSTSFYSVENL